MNRKLKIATAKNRFETKWTNREVLWDELVKRLKKTKRTSETVEEYLAMKKDEQDAIKDVGGFVGGSLKEGLRRNGYVEVRSIVTLDLDDCNEEILDDLALNINNECFIYSTHKHKKQKPRLRLLFPLTRDVTPEEYEAVARKLAEELSVGMEAFDDTTYQAARLMFWPSTSKDGEYIAEEYHGDWVDPDKILALYIDWKNTEEWPTSIREGKVVAHEKKKLGDPTEKNGIIGAFCKAYTISAAIAKFLPDVYIKGRSDDRYTYAAGSTANGLIVYDDKIAYSNHSTDPVGGKAVNAFDLVRLHKFGDLDKNEAPDTPVASLPSYKAMKDFAEEDEEVKAYYTKTVKREIHTALEDFSDEVEEIVDDKWMDDLQTGKNGTVAESVENIELIFNNDPNLKGLVGFNEFKFGLPELRKKTPWNRVPSDVWSDSDDANLRVYLAKVYGLHNWAMIKDQLTIAMENNAFDPVKEYIESTKWDGVARCESLFIKYLGAEDTEYVRTITRKMLVAAIARVYRPGCKFDYMVTLVGPQGIGKSLLIYKLGHGWTSDTLPDVKTEKAFDALQGIWLMEIGELAALKKTDRESIKLFISKTEDTYRKAYARNTSVNKRRCIFIGTTNDDAFLNDSTGNRRFLPIDVHEDKVETAVWDGLDEAEISQIWAEAKTLFDNGENIMEMPGEVKKEATIKQEAHSIDNPLIGLIEEFLDKKIPLVDWNRKSIDERMRYFRSTDEFNDETVDEKTLGKRYQISAIEIWCECLQKDKESMTFTDSVRIIDALRTLGWLKDDKQHRVGPYGKQRCYVRPYDPDDPELPF